MGGKRGYGRLSANLAGLRERLFARSVLRIVLKLISFTYIYCKTRGNSQCHKHDQSAQFSWAGNEKLFGADLRKVEIMVFVICSVLWGMLGCP